MFCIWNSGRRNAFIGLPKSSEHGLEIGHRPQSCTSNEVSLFWDWESFTSVDYYPCIDAGCMYLDTWPPYIHPCRLYTYYGGYNNYSTMEACAPLLQTAKVKGAPEPSPCVRLAKVRGLCHLAPDATANTTRHTRPSTTYVQLLALFGFNSTNSAHDSREKNLICM